MAIRISDVSRLKQGRGRGHGANYVPWIKVGEFHNIGTSSIIVDYKTGRQVHLFSRGELFWWHYFRWKEDVEEIREQFPLNLEGTEEIASRLGIRHPMVDGETMVMTTDLLLTHADRTLEAICIKSNRKSANKPRCLEKMKLEKDYWESHGVPWRIAYREDLNMTLIHNIMDVVAVYNIADVRDPIGLARHLIAHKTICVDMTQPLNYRAIVKDNELEEIWKNSTTQQ